MTRWYQVVDCAEGKLQEPIAVLAETPEQAASKVMRMVLIQKAQSAEPVARVYFDDDGIKMVELYRAI